MKFKSILCSFFQTQNTLFVQKSIRHVDASASQDEDYQIRREKNNESVRKSRAKNRAKIQDCADRVKELKNENLQLTSQLSTMQSELSTLKNLFQNFFSFNGLSIKPSEIPTTTLYKIIMKQDLNTSTTSASQTQLDSVASSPCSSSSSQDEFSTESSLYNNVDRFYINHLKNAILNFNLSSPSADNGLLRKSISQDHDYSIVSD